MSTVRIIQRRMNFVGSVLALVGFFSLAVVVKLAYAGGCGMQEPTNCACDSIVTQCTPGPGCAAGTGTAVFNGPFCCATTTATTDCITGMANQSANCKRVCNCIATPGGCGAGNICQDYSSVVKVSKNCP